MSTNIAIVLIIATNWVTTGYYTDLSGKRYEEQAGQVITNVEARIFWTCSNDVHLAQSINTNRLTRRVEVLPPLPQGMRSKE